MRLLQRSVALATGFAGAHALNAGFGMVYTLMQTLVFARVLPTELYAQTVAATAIGLYTAPINQAVARANFVLLRGRTVGEGTPSGAPEAAAAYHASQLILLLVTVTTPLLLNPETLVRYAALAAFLFTCIYSNIWFAEMQMAMMATGHALMFERLSLLRRIGYFALLAWLWTSVDFLDFALALAALTLALHGFLILKMRHESDLFAWPRHVEAGAVRRHLVRLWVSLQATFAEWLTLSGPYALFSLKFGVSPSLIALDAVMKLVRITISVARNLSEIALPRVSQAVLSGTARRARSTVLAVLGLTAAGALVVGGVTIFAERRLFDLLLGANNTVPRGAGVPTAVALVAGAGFAIGSHLVGHSGATAAIRRIMWTAIATSTILAALIFLPLTLLEAIWLVSAAMVVVAVVAVRELQAMMARNVPPMPLASA